MNHFIAVSILSCDFLNLKSELDKINESKADWVHLDIMDGVFVPNISFGFPILKAVKKHSDKLIDVHLMIVEPEKYIDKFASYNIDYLSIHFEACKHLNRTINHIKSLNIKAGVVISPQTPVLLLEDIINDLDMVCIMSVNPGYGGQKYIKNTLNKVSALKELILRKNSKALIQVDGGIDADNIKELSKNGANVFVVGSSVFDSKNVVEKINSLKSI